MKVIMYLTINPETKRWEGYEDPEDFVGFGDAVYEAPVPVIKVEVELPDDAEERLKRDASWVEV